MGRKSSTFAEDCLQHWTGTGAKPSYVDSLCQVYCAVRDHKIHEFMLGSLFFTMSVESQVPIRNKQMNPISLVDVKTIADSVTIRSEA